MSKYKRSLFIISLVILTVIISAGCSKTSTNKPAAKAVTVEVPKVYKQGEEAFILDDSGKQMYSIKINGVKAANNFEYKSDFSAAKEIIEVDYTYKNIDKVDESNLTIHTQDLLVSDSTGAVAEFSSMFPKQKPQTIPKGTNCTVQGYYGLSNKSDKVKINFSSLTYKKSGTLTFEIPVK